MNINRPYKFPMPKFTPQAIPPSDLFSTTPKLKIPPRVTPKYAEICPQHVITESPMLQEVTAKDDREAKKTPIWAKRKSDSGGCEVICMRS